MRTTRKILAGVSALVLTTGAIFSSSAAFGSAPPGGNNFESPVVPAKKKIMLVDPSAGSGGIGGYDLTVVYDGDVQLVRKNLIRPASGKQSLDLNGTQPGRVCGEYDASPGGSGTYRVSFRYAGNPLGGPRHKTFDVIVYTHEAEPDPGFYKVSFSYNTKGAKAKSLKWRYGSIHFQNRVGEIGICFQSTTPGRFGPMLDDLKYVQLP